jgi:TPP-dependent pyruvate/acetoin dehydrogenase alpha subunit
VLKEDEREQLDADAIAAVDAAVAFADASPEPKAESLYDDVYVLGNQVKGSYH